MALITLNHKNLNLEVRVGILETYKPNKDVKKIYKDIEKLKNNVSEKLKEITKSNDLNGANLTLSQNKDMMFEFKQYIDTEYNKQVLELLKFIDSVNEQICPGYKELKAKQGY